LSDKFNGTRAPEMRLEAITGVILAGGQARRMGGRDKGLVAFRGRPLVEWVVAALGPQVAALAVNANRNREAYEALGYPVIADQIEGFQGPLAGFASAMAASSTPWIVTVPCDGPFLAPDLVERLCAAMQGAGAEIAVATDGKRMQPVYALLPVALAPSLQAFLAAGERKIDLWYARHKVALADLSDRPESFANINSEDDVALLQGEVLP
jgi:molybdenum cofactor guanylyltransferase